MVIGVDAICSNLRGDVVGKLGLGYDRLGPIKPQIVCAHLTAYGRDDERRAWPGYDYIMQAEAGHTSVTGDPGTPPTRFGLSIVDWMGGLSLAVGLLAGIVNARATGVGGDTDVNLFDLALYNLNYLGVWQMNAGYRPQRLPRGAHPSQGPAQMCRTADGWMYIMASKEKFWRQLCVLIGHPEFVEDARFRTTADREKNRDELTPLLDTALGARITVEWMDRFAGIVPAAPVLDVEEALSTAYVKSSGRILEVPFGEGEALRILRGPIRRRMRDERWSCCRSSASYRCWLGRAPQGDCKSMVTKTTDVLGLVDLANKISEGDSDLRGRTGPSAKHPAGPSTTLFYDS